MIIVFLFSVKGWNWGTANFNGSTLAFEVGKHDAFEIPLTYVSSCANAKNEVINLYFFFLSKSSDIFLKYIVNIT